MERPLWDRIQEIYHSTLPMDPSERDAFLARACGQDPVIEREVSSLLEADRSSAGFLESPVFEVGLKIISGNRAKKTENTGEPVIEDLIGRMIDDRYLVETELSKGGMGKVYLARDQKLHHRPVVVKILLQTSLQDPYVVKKFRQEVEALARIDHPGVVSVLGAGELGNGKPYIVMQYVSGVTLRSQIPSEGMELERVALILKQIGDALEDVHEKGIFHRDLKPDNVMLQLKSGTEFVKVVDFGIAKVKDSVVAPSTVNNVPIGTLVYMSPEQLRGGEKITAASDIYSMAVIAYEMVTGRRPFTPASGPQLLEMHRAGVRVRPADLCANLSTEAQAIILRALSFEPAHRYQSATEFGDSLARALAEHRERPTKQIVRRLTTEFPDSSGLPGPRTIQIDGSALAPAPFGEGIERNSKHRPLTFGKTQFAVISGVLIIVLGLGIWLLGFRKDPEQTGAVVEPSPSIETSLTPRSFTFSLTVQRMRNGRRYGVPFPSTGQDVFENGDRFRLNISSNDPGYVYLFNEGPPEPNGSSFTIIYPTPTINDGSATLGADQFVRTEWNEFAGQAGPENFWIVWATAPITQLESAKAEAFKRPNGALTAEGLSAVKEFLQTTQEKVKPKISRDKKSQLTTVRGAGDVLVKMVQFQHQ